MASGEARREPAGGLGGALALAARVVRELVVADPADREVLRLRVRQVDAADGGCRGHREALGQRQPGTRRVEQLEELRLLAVVRARRIAEGRADSAVALV